MFQHCSGNSAVAFILLLLSGVGETGTLFGEVR